MTNDYVKHSSAFALRTDFSSSVRRLGVLTHPDASVTTSLSRQRSTAAVGLNALMRSMGTTIAGAVMAIVLTSTTMSVGGAQLPTEAAFQLCFMIGAVAALAGAGVTLLIRRSSRGADG